MAWTHVQIPESVFNGETNDDWYLLNGQQGDAREGMINLIISYSVSSSKGSFTVVNTYLFRQSVLRGAMYSFKINVGHVKYDHFLLFMQRHAGKCYITILFICVAPFTVQNYYIHIFSNLDNDQQFNVLNQGCIITADVLIRQ